MCIPGNEFLEFSKFSISRLEPEYLNTFQKTLIYLLIDWHFNFLPVFKTQQLCITMGDGGGWAEPSWFPITQVKRSRLALMWHGGRREYCQTLLVAKLVKAGTKFPVQWWHSYEAPFEVSILPWWWCFLHSQWDVYGVDEISTFDAMTHFYFAQDFLCDCIVCWKGSRVRM